MDRLEALGNSLSQLTMYDLKQAYNQVRWLRMRFVNDNADTSMILGWNKKSLGCVVSIADNKLRSLDRASETVFCEIGGTEGEIHWNR